jgi:hypothetical protein
LAVALGTLRNTVCECGFFWHADNLQLRLIECGFDDLLVWDVVENHSPTLLNEVERWL